MKISGMTVSLRPHTLLHSRRNGANFDDIFVYLPETMALRTPVSNSTTLSPAVGRESGQGGPPDRATATLDLYQFAFLPALGRTVVLDWRRSLVLLLPAPFL